MRLSSGDGTLSVRCDIYIYILALSVDQCLAPLRPPPRGGGGVLGQMLIGAVVDNVPRTMGE